ncbi:MAG: hypothetical protein MK185_15665 [Saccharospirillaceae bacterium]|nr:hypothetical protein [Saccharospirillaceae bacterium]
MSVKKILLSAVLVSFISVSGFVIWALYEYQQQVEEQAYSEKQHQQKIEEYDRFLQQQQDELDVLNAESDRLMESDRLLDEKIRQLDLQLLSTQRASAPSQSSASDLNGVSQ